MSRNLLAQHCYYCCSNKVMFVSVHAVKECVWGEVVVLHSFLTSALNGGED